MCLIPSERKIICSISKTIFPNTMERVTFVLAVVDSALFGR